MKTSELADKQLAQYSGYNPAACHAWANVWVERINAGDTSAVAKSKADAAQATVIKAQRT